MSHNPEQVQMIWLPDQTVEPSKLPEGYTLRTYRLGDQAGFYELMNSVGWTGWDADRLQPWLFRVLPEGWFFAVYEEKIVGTCMATHDPTWEVPFCGEVGWTAVHPDHQGLGIGTAVARVVMACFLDAGYSTIHLYTEIWRKAALKVYLQLGFVPYLTPPETIDHWHKICGQLDWPYTPERWPSSIGL